MNWRRQLRQALNGNGFVQPSRPRPLLLPFISDRRLSNEEVDSYFDYLARFTFRVDDEYVIHLSNPTEKK